MLLRLEKRACDWMGYMAGAVNVLFLDLSGGYSGAHLIIIVIVKLYGLCTFKYLSYFLHQKIFFKKTFQDSQK